MSQSNWAHFSSTFGVTYFGDTPLLLFSKSANISGTRIDLLFGSVPAILLLIPSMTFSSRHLSFGMLVGICPCETNLVLLSLLCISFQLWLSKIKNYNVANSSQSCITHVLAKCNLALPYVKSLLRFGWAGLSAALLHGSSLSWIHFLVFSS